VNGEEVDSFFQSSFELLTKRRCPCIWNGRICTGYRVLQFFFSFMYVCIITRLKATICGVKFMLL
jgi:hypothetical protein